MGMMKFMIQVYAELREGGHGKCEKEKQEEEGIW
jgi:hypothetical protein